MDIFFKGLFTIRKCTVLGLFFILSPCYASFNDNYDHNLKSSVYSIGQGDTVKKLLKKSSINNTDINNFIAESKNIKEINNANMGRYLFIQKDNNNNLTKMFFKIDKTNIIEVKKSLDKNNFIITKNQFKHQIVVNDTNNINALSFKQEALKIGISEKSIDDIQDIFVKNFNYNTLAYAKISFVFENTYIEGLKIDKGKIILAKLEIGNKQEIVIRREKNNIVSYFDQNGKVLSKAFIDFPLEKGELSSDFTSSRIHPIFGKVKSHSGIDFSAPLNTPILAASDGIISFIGNRKGYGNVIEIQHNDKYTTVYGHMNKFNKDLQLNDRVSKKQIIGYVGKTGYATGTHLHYELRVNNIPANPLTTKIDNNYNLEKNEKIAFNEKIKPYLAKLNNNLSNNIAILE